MDDVGYNFERGEEILALPGDLTLGVLPFAPHARRIAERAVAEGREIILHQPMEPLVSDDLEPGTLELSKSPERFQHQFVESLASLPGVMGVNNHTGSLLTAERRPMEWLMAQIRRRGLYFLDSRTTADSVAETVARDWSVPTIRRDVFLDHVPQDAALSAAWEKARKRGRAVIIAHPYPVTMAFLDAELRRLPADVRLMRLSALVEPVRRPDRRSPALLRTQASPSISLAR
jgi:polysaccharide deacetylase 2 family uncharacterized protein YibQ